MKGFNRGDRGFTLVELLIVVAILGVLAAVVIPSVLGLMGRGATQAYETDEEVIQLAVATFWSDVHEGVYLKFDVAGNVTPATTKWSCTGAAAQLRGHYYPTALAYVNQHQLYVDTANVEVDNEDPYNDGSYMLRDADGNKLDYKVDADNNLISAHAIWMGLLVNDDGTNDSAVGTPNRETAAPVDGDIALYLQEMPESSGAWNGNPDPGIYTWVVGARGEVYGVYVGSNDYWYAGYGGSYP